MKKVLPLVSLLAVMAMVGCTKTTSSAASSNKPTSKATSKEAASSKASSKVSVSLDPATHEHEEWTAGTKVADVTPETCECGAKAYRVDVADATGWNDPSVKMNGKSAPNNQSDWNITGAIPAGVYDVYLSAKMSYSSHGNRTFANQWENDPDGGTNADKETEDPFRYFFKLDDGEAINPATTQTWGELGYSASEAVFVNTEAKVTITATSAKFSLLHGNIGYSLIIDSIRLVPAVANK